MGKKRIIQQTQDEVLKEREGVDVAVKKSEAKSVSAKRMSLVRIYINVSYNNTLMTVCDEGGNVITWVSAGAIGFKGSKKSTPFAASKIAEMIAERVHRLGVNDVAVFIRGVGSGRESAMRSLINRGLNLVSIKDITPLPHNGCRPKKVRRV